MLGVLDEGKRASGREDALGTTGVERVERQGCPHCAGREIVGWGRSDGLLRFRCKSCGRTFNALTKTPMAHLRKKEKWLDHAQAMIEGKSLAKTAELCGVHPTTAFRWRHRFLRAPADDKPRTLSGIVEADETFILESFKGRWSDLPRKARKRGGKARHPGPYQDNIPVLVARDRKGATFDAVLPQVDSASIAAALTGRRYARQSSRRRRRQADRRLRPPSRHSLPRRALAGKAGSRGAAPAHQQRQRLSRPPQAMAQPLQRRRHQEPAKLPRLAPRPRSLGPTPRPAKLDRRRHRKRTIPTDNAIRARRFVKKLSIFLVTAEKGLRGAPSTTPQPVERRAFSRTPYGMVSLLLRFVAKGGERRCRPSPPMKWGTVRRTVEGATPPGCLAVYLLRRPPRADPATVQSSSPYTTTTEVY